MRGLAWWRSYVARFDRVVWMLVGTVFVESMGRFLVDPYLTLYLVHQGFSLGAVGVVLAAAPLASGIIGLVGGSLSDAWGRRPVQVLGVTASGLALLGFGFAGNSAPVLALLNFANGMSRALYRPATQAAIVDVTPAHLRAEAFGLRRVVVNLGAVLGPVVGLLLYQWIPSIGFWLAGGLNLAVGLYLALMVPETRPRAGVPRGAGAADVGVGRGGHPGAVAAAGPATPAAPSGWAVVLGDGVLWLWTLGTAITWGIFRLVDTNLPVHLANQQVPAWVYGTLLPINALLVVVVQLPLNYRLRQARMGLTMLLAALPYALGYLGFGFMRAPLLVMGSMVLLTAGELLGAAAGPRFVPELAPRELRGRYMGTAGLQDLGRAVVPLVGGWVMAAWGGSALFALAAVLALVGGGTSFVADAVRLARPRPAAADSNGLTPAGTRPGSQARVHIAD